MSATRIIRTARRSADDVLSVLVELGLDEPVEEGLIEVMNKIDLLDPTTREASRIKQLRNSQSVALSAVTGEGCEGCSN